MEAEILSYILLFLFLLIVINVYKGYLYQINQKKFTLAKPKLSLIIAVKNEKDNIIGLLDSLEKLNYPAENYEVIFVDDNSTDSTYDIIRSKISGKKNYNVIKALNKKIEGKKGALTIGIENAKNNFIVITDADCKPEAEWLTELAGALDYGYDFVFGVAPIKSGNTFVEKLSAFENLRNTFLTIAAVGLNIPYSAAARSFAFRKKSFERLGGYGKTTETLSGDDDLLLREAVIHKMLIGTVVEPDAFVFSETPKTFDEYFRQKKRHLQTSFYYLLKQKMFLGLWHVTNLISLFSVILIFFSSFFILPFAGKIIYDFFVVVKNQKQLGHKFKLYEVVYLQIVFEIFIVINFFKSLSGKVEWK
jgi:cellulose synthase/poly-beta-1,6-N-acetylglucosamine synthase-like glycosyltransferase